MFCLLCWGLESSDRAGGGALHHKPASACLVRVLLYASQRDALSDFTS